MRTWSFAKAHGTLNDFVIIQDRYSILEVSAHDVRFLCDRRAGIGADGMLRAVKAERMPEWDGDPNIWFMDYRNADGSIAEMCGNGLRAFVRYLLEEDLVAGAEIPIATRAGLRIAEPLTDGSIRTSMGAVAVADDRVSVRLGDRRWLGTPADVGNPHVVVVLQDADELAQLDLTHAPTWDPDDRFPQGVNVEFIVELAPGHLRMRVYERGAGETMSCGTGVVAAAACYAASGHLDRVRVDVPGGTLQVELGSDQVFLTGPAVVVSAGEVYLPESPVQR